MFRRRLPSRLSRCRVPPALEASSGQSPPSAARCSSPKPGRGRPTSAARPLAAGAWYDLSAAIAALVVSAGSVVLYSGSHCSKSSCRRFISRVRSLVKSAWVRLHSCTWASASSSAYTRGSVAASSRSSVATDRASRRSLLPGVRIPRRRAAVQRPFTSCTRSPCPARYCARPRPRNQAPSTAQVRSGHWRDHSSSAAQADAVLGILRSPWTPSLLIATARWTCLCASTPIQITPCLLLEASSRGTDDRRASLGSCDRLLSSQTVGADFAGRTTLPVQGSSCERPRVYGS